MAELTAQTHGHVGFGMRKKTEWTKGRGSQDKIEFGQDTAICLLEEAICAKYLQTDDGRRMIALSHEMS